jgi:DNA-binding NarL/FixJ family response regulator
MALSSEQSASLKSGASCCLSPVFRGVRLFWIIECVDQTRRRILIVDHNRLLREGLSSLVMRQLDMNLVGVATSGSEAVQLCREQRPEVVLMDLDLPGGTGIKSIREIRESDSTICILGLFTYSWDECAALALAAGARACLSKDRLNRDLVSLIRKCLNEGL